MNHVNEKGPGRIPPFVGTAAFENMGKRDVWPLPQVGRVLLPELRVRATHGAAEPRSDTFIHEWVRPHVLQERRHDMVHDFMAVAFSERGVT
jgi:hypothetical protein